MQGLFFFFNFPKLFVVFFSIAFLPNENIPDIKNQ